MRAWLARLGWALTEGWDAFWFCYENYEELRTVEMMAAERRMVDAAEYDDGTAE